jgi:hypothetical protein
MLLFASDCLKFENLALEHLTAYDPTRNMKQNVVGALGCASWHLQNNRARGNTLCLTPVTDVRTTRTAFETQTTTNLACTAHFWDRFPFFNVQHLQILFVRSGPNVAQHVLANVLEHGIHGNCPDEVEALHQQPQIQTPKP